MFFYDYKVIRTMGFLSNSMVPCERRSVLLMAKLMMTTMMTVMMLRSDSAKSIAD